MWRPEIPGLIAAALVLAAWLAPPAAAQPAPGMEAPHPAPAPGGAAETSPAVRKVTERVLCMCGGCVNQTLHECTCGMAAQERQEVAAAIEGGRSPEEVIQAYVDRYGPQVMSTPDRRGSHLVGWLVPFAAAAAGLAGLAFVIRGWVRAREPVAVAAGGAEPPPPGSEEARYRARLEQELKDFEG